MNKKIRLNKKNIYYKINKSKKAKRLSIAVHSNASVVVTMPRLFPEIIARRFLKEKQDWIIKKINHFKKFKNKKLTINKADYKKKKEIARKLILEKIEKYNKIYNLKFNRISIRNQKTRWGSCSCKGNLNFNYKIIYLSEKLADYIVVHELCHLQEMNHSKKFWKLVAKTFPDYLKIKKKLRKEGVILQ